MEPGDRRIVRDGMVVHHPNYVFAPKVLRGLHGHCFEQSIRRTFQDVVRGFRPEVVLGCWAYPDGWAAARLAREANLPIAIKVQGSDVLQVGLEGSRARRAGEALSMADAVIAVGRHVADRAILLGANRSKVHVVYNGIDTTLFRPGSKEEARRELRVSLDESMVTYVGNLAPVKGVDVLIRALGSLVRAGRPVRCALVGDGAMRGSLERLAASLGLGDHVRFMGSCPLSRVAAWHRATDLLVLPSLSERLA
jgi:glycosyltransferase involved in cell wall biosynthesis